MTLRIRVFIGGLAAAAVLVGGGLALPAVAHAGVRASGAGGAGGGARAELAPTGGIYTFDNESADTLQLIPNSVTGPITAPQTIAAMTTAEIDEVAGGSGFAAYSIHRGSVTLPGYLLVILRTDADGTDHVPACDAHGVTRGVSCTASGVTITLTVLPPASVTGETVNDTAGTLTLASSANPGRDVRRAAQCVHGALHGRSLVRHGAGRRLGHPDLRHRRHAQRDLHQPRGWRRNLRHHPRRSRLQLRHRGYRCEPR